LTLILTCATRESVVQVSDRRLTRDGQLVDDNTTKAIYYCGRVAIGYTGVAKIQGVDTAERLARELAPHEQLEPALAAVAASLGPTLAAQHEPEKQWLAIVASGWATWKGTNLRPFVSTVSNFLDDQGQWLEKARPQFVHRLDWLDPGNPYLLSIAGQQLGDDEIQELDRHIRRALKAQNVPVGIVEALGEQIRAISDDGSKRGKRVGKGLIVQALSKQAIERQFREGRWGLATGLHSEVNSTIYVAPDGSTDRWESPWLVCGGGVMIGGGGTVLPGSQEPFSGI
jgi:hypothetical protein